MMGTTVGILGKRFSFVLTGLGLAATLAGCPPDPVAPSASFSAAPREGTAPLTVHFTDTSTVGSNPLDGYAWDFGDGTHAGLKNPTHVYTTPGEYTVTFTVSAGELSDTETKTAHIEVTAEGEGEG